MTATCDTSVLVAALASWHPQRDLARRAVTARVDALCGHVLVECYSVLTRLPAPNRLSPTSVGGALESLDRPVIHLSDHRGFVAQLASAGLGGGATYDALVAATAAEHDCVLLTLDLRASSTYDALGVRYELLA